MVTTLPTIWHSCLINLTTTAFYATIFSRLTLWCVKIQISSQNFLEFQIFIIIKNVIEVVRKIYSVVRGKRVTIAVSFSDGDARLESLWKIRLLFSCVVVLISTLEIHKGWIHFNLFKNMLVNIYLGQSLF